MKQDKNISAVGQTDAEGEAIATAHRRLLNWIGQEALNQLQDAVTIAVDTDASVKDAVLKFVNQLPDIQEDTLGQDVLCVLDKLLQSYDNEVNPY